MLTSGTTDAQVNVKGNVYGGGNVAAVGGNSEVNVSQSGTPTVEGSLFGGGNEAGITGTASVEMTTGVVESGVYGGCNTNGTVNGDVTVTITGGTVGTSSVAANGVFGGGYGSSTATEGNVTVTIGDKSAASSASCPTIYGNVYGGSALGSVNKNYNNTTKVDILNATLNGDIYGGGLGDATLDANGYVSSVVTPAIVNGQVLVNIGAADQDDDKCHIVISGDVFGCNNLAGSPQRNVNVHIYKTAHNTTNAATYLTNDGNGDPTYAIHAVYGGGNQASYAPENGLASSAMKATVHVHTCDNTIEYLYGGGNAAAAVGVRVNIINGGRFGWVFGGGNGAGTGNPGADIGAGGITLDVHGGQILHLFGGSNERGNIVGGASVNIDNTGGCSEYVTEFFGGSNLVDMTTNIETTIGCGTLFGTVYGGSNAASITGNVTLNIRGGTMDYVYGGSKGVAVGDVNIPAGKAADILDNTETQSREGNVTLNLYGGTINEAAFGGSNVKGNIEGVITVNVLDHIIDDCEPLHIKDIYGAGNITPYVPKDITVNEVVQKPVSPIVNVMNIRSGSSITGNVYGGGNQAPVTSNPRVTIGFDATTMSTYLSNGYNKGFIANVSGNVYGGGNEATVTGNTTLIVQRENTLVTGKLFGGGNQAGVDGKATVEMVIGTVRGGIYGGCNASGNVSGDIVVQVQDGVVGTDASHTADIFGGGYGSTTTTGGDVNVTIGIVGGAGDNPFVHGSVYGGSALGSVNGSTSNTTHVELLSGSISESVYGGGLGQKTGVNGAMSDIAATVKGNVEVLLNGSDVNLGIFGCNNLNGAPEGTVKVDVRSGHAANVVGGGNQAAYTAPVGTPNYPQITITGGNVEYKVIGGGNAADVTGNPIINISGGNISYDDYLGGTARGIYGGSNASGILTGNTTVNVTGGNIGIASKRANVYGGGYGQSTSVTGNVQVAMGALTTPEPTPGPTVYGDIYGGSALGSVNTNSSNTITVDILSGKFIGDVYGGGHGQGAAAAVADDPATPEDESSPAVAEIPADVNGVVTVNIGKGHITTPNADLAEVVYAIDGGEASFTTYQAIENDTTVTKGGRIFGCNNEAGSPEDDVFVHIWQTKHTDKDLASYINIDDRAYALYQVYGGGNHADYIPAGVSDINSDISTKKVHVHLHGCDNTVNQVFGGCNAANAYGVHTIVDGGRYREVFGGGNGVKIPANIGKGYIYLNIKGGRIGWAFDQCNRQGSVTSGVNNVTYYEGGGNCGDVIIEYHFCGGNYADVYGDINETMSCEDNKTFFGLYGGCRLGTVYGNINLTIYGGHFDVIYGGSQGSDDYAANVKKFPTPEQLAADADHSKYSDALRAWMTANPGHEGTGGNINLTIKGGTIGSVFGGCDLNGNVEGKINIIIDDEHDPACPLSIDYVYGASRLAKYDPLDNTISSPHIQLKDGSVNFNVFGGGMGSETGVNDGLVTSNPSIEMKPVLPETFQVKGNIYGGGKMASVGNFTRNATTNAVESCAANTGNTLIEITAGQVGVEADGQSNDMGNVFGGGVGKAGSDFANYAFVNNTTVTISGTTYIVNSLYGGGSDGHVLNNATVTVSSGTIGKKLTLAERKISIDGQFAHIRSGNVYGGGSGATIIGTQTNAESGNEMPIYSPTAGRVYGNTSVTVSGGTVRHGVFGGGNIASVGTFTTNAAGIATYTSGGTSSVTINGTALIGPKVADLTTATADELAAAKTAMGIANTPSLAQYTDTSFKYLGANEGWVFGSSRGLSGGFLKNLSFSNIAEVTISGNAQIVGSVCGGGENGHVQCSTDVQISGGIIGGIPLHGTTYTVPSDGSEYAGVTMHLAADEAENAEDSHGAGHDIFRGNVFGGGKGTDFIQWFQPTNKICYTAGRVYGNTKVSISGTAKIYRSVIGGGTIASVGTFTYKKDAENKDTRIVNGYLTGTGTSTVTISGGAIGTDGFNNGDVYGGGLGIAGSYEASTPERQQMPDLAYVSNANVSVSGGAIAGSVYGGSANGHVQDNTLVTISGGTIGIADAVNDFRGNVYGGGGGTGFYFDNLGNPEYSQTAGRTYGDTRVDVTDGTIWGHVFGGGEMASVGYEEPGDKGNATVNIGATDGNEPPTYSGSATLHRNVYGANNFSGTPYGNVYVNIYSTARTAKQVASYTIADREYAIANVFGGGKEADYAPDNGSTSSSKRANTHVYTCLNTIENLFGGGDAAAALGVVTVIDGGRFDRIFGGGNGEANPADIGAGGTNLTVKAGKIRQLFGGSNMQGSISGNLVTNINGENRDDSDCPEVIDEFYAGSNMASISGNLNTDIACGTGTITEAYGGCRMAEVDGNIHFDVHGGTISSVYGGSKGRVAVAADPANDIEAVSAIEANISGNIILDLLGGHIGYVHGGSNQNGNIFGTIEVTIDSNQTGDCGLTIENNVYGGSNITMYNPDDKSVLSPIVNIKHGTVGLWLTSAEQADIDAMSAADRTAWNNEHGNVYGGGDGQGSRNCANPSVYMGNGIYSGEGANPHKPCVKGDIYGGGRTSRVFGHTLVDMTNGTVEGNLYGGGKGCRIEESPGDDQISTRAIIDGWTTVNMKSGTVEGSIYGGGDLGSVGHLLGTSWSRYLSETTEDQAKYGNTYVTVSSGIVNGSVFGGGRGLNDNAYVEYGRVGTTEVQIKSGSEIAGSVYGGGENGNVLNGTSLSMSGGTVEGSLFGGGNSADVGYGIGQGTAVTIAVRVDVDNEHGKIANTAVSLTGGTVKTGVYGGSNEVGTVTGNAVTDLVYGTVGTSNARADGIFGGGQGVPTQVKGNVSLTLNGATVYSDIYGGSAMGTVNTTNANNTTVNILSGNVYGDIYGGGLGRLADNSDPQNPIAAATANVNGKIYVNVGQKDGAYLDESVTPNIYRGLYSGAAYINTYQVSSTTYGGSIYGCNNVNGSPQDAVYVNIYGTAHPTHTDVGDEEATYEDEDYAIYQVFGGGNNANYAPTGQQAITTHIYSCNNTIARVFGGCNASDATKTRLIIDGGRFGHVFGGGNGEVSAAHTTDSLYMAEHGGTYKSHTDAQNNHGSIPANRQYVTTSDSCGVVTIVDRFLASNLGDHIGDVNITIQCPEASYRNLYCGCNKGDLTGSVNVTIMGGTYENIFGGSKGTNDDPANISGSINLTIKGGTIGNVYGGCDINGSAMGNVTVTIDSVDGACPLTVHNVYGGGRDAAYKPTTATAHATVNILNGTISKTLDAAATTGNVFGGGQGSKAVFCQQEICNGGNPSCNNSNPCSSAAYGPVVNIGDPSVARKVAIVEGNVYGGGDLANSNGCTQVNIVKGNTVVHGDVYGGARAASVSRSIAVNIGSNGASEGPTIQGDVYGGSAFGNVNCSTAYTPAPQTDVTLYKGTVRNLFGGGLGQVDPQNIPAYVYGPVAVKVYGGTVTGGVYGCNNINGTPDVAVTVDIYGSDNTDNAIANVFGGGNESDYAPTVAMAPVVTIHNGGNGLPKIGTVYGGGNAAGVPETDVTVYGGTIGNVYGGGNGAVNAAPVADISTVKIYGGTIGNVFGGNNIDGNIGGAITVTLDEKAETGEVLCSMSVGNVFGGGNQAIYSPTALGALGSNFSPYVHLMNGKVTGEVFGGGKGSTTDVMSGAVITSNPKVLMDPVLPSTFLVEGNIYGGGEESSVGNYTRNATTKAVESCVATTGKTTVEISGGKVGPFPLLMPDDRGHVFGGGKGIVADPTVNTLVEHLNYVNETHVTISGTAFVKGSVYGGGFNGRVLGDTYVAVSGGQIGCGKVGDASDLDRPYTEGAGGEWETATSLAECPSWPYGQQPVFEERYASHDIYANQSGNLNEYPDGTSTEGGRYNADDGHTWYGNVFGGGSGYYPYAQHEWLRSAGAVYGNTHVTITGGHILTSIYGGNELTDVGTYDNNGKLKANTGNCTVSFSGTATLGVPRTLSQIDAHPVTCYLFGAGKGDHRVFFNKWTNVGSTLVTVSGGKIFGSVFGGGEDGHVIGDAVVNIQDGAYIGTQGLSYVDGNIFGGGRGFSGDALTAGAVCGNITVNITGGTMLGSIYGGGRLASVGIDLKNTNETGYGLIQDGNNHGVITVNISGNAIIGNTRPYIYYTGDKPSDLAKTTYDDYHILQHTISGNVYGGCMGRTTRLNGTTNPIWPNLAKAKKTIVNISGNPIILSSVYGGGEYGTVLTSTSVTITGGTIGSDIAPSDPADQTALNHALQQSLKKASDDGNGNIDYDENFTTKHYHFGCVFGGGYGDSLYTPEELNTTYTPQFNKTPAIANMAPVDLAGRVFGNTSVSIEGGHVLDNIYGGGDLASVGTYDYSKNINADDFVLSGTGICAVSVTGGVVGPLDYTGMNAYVYAAGKGVGDDKDEHYKDYCNVGSSSLTVSGGKVWGSLFGGGADCHVLGNTSVTVHTGADVGVDGTTTWDGNLFGGGRNYLNTNHTAGRVAGNITITMDGGFLNGSIFGGGRLALTGIDNDGDVSSFTTAGIYDSVYHGKVTVNVSGGTIGFHGDESPMPAGYTLLTKSDESIGDIYGSGKGDTKEYLDIIGGRVMNTVINISGSPIIHGSVYGGGEMASIGWWGNDGSFVQQTGSSSVKIIGSPTIGTLLELDKDYMLDRVNMPSKWTVFDTTADGHKLRVSHTCTGNVFGGSMGDVDTNSIHWPSFARSRTTTVVIEGGTIMSKVYGGAEQGAVTEDTRVTIKGGTIGATLTDSLNIPYHFGSVFGGGYGSSSYKIMTDDDEELTYHPNTANDSNMAPIHIAGRVYGNTYVSIEGGNINKNVYGGGEMASVGYVNGTTYENGNCNVTVTGGLIGGSGTTFASPIATTDICGHVFGGSKGLVGQDYSINALTGKKNNYSSECNVNTTHVIIGDATHTPTIIGSVFGGGEDGHVLDSTLVEINDGLIGSGTKYTGDDEYINNYVGNVFGGGLGIDLDLDGKLSYTAGQILGSTHVKIAGGHVCSNVYGGGSIASVGEGVVKDDSDPYQLFKMYRDIDYRTDKQGRTWVEVTGGLIGIYAAPTNNGDGTWTRSNDAFYGSVFGGGRGHSGHSLDNKNPYSYFAYTNNCVVEIKYPSVDASPTGTSHIVGNVFGGGNNGHVKNSTYVTVTGGRIGSDGNKGLGDLDGNVFGGGKGTERYQAYRSKYDTETHKWRYINKSTGAFQNDTTGALVVDTISTTSGLVYGNTYVTIGTNSTGVDDILVLHHVFGGGDMGSVGDYTLAFTDNAAYTDNHLAATGRMQGEIYPLLSSTGSDGFHDNNTSDETGNCFVTINGGTLGTTGGNNGMVFGGCRGDIGAIGSLFDSVAYFNNTTVTIGATSNYTNPLIHGSVYGGGENGHGTGSTEVNVHGGRIGTNDRTYVNTKALDDAVSELEEWLSSQIMNIAIKESQIRNLRRDLDPAANVYATLSDADKTRKQDSITLLQGEINTIRTQHATEFARLAEAEAQKNDSIDFLAIRGNVYGGGCGTDKFADITDGNKMKYNPRAGVVYGNSTVNIDGGFVERNVYGSGSMASLGLKVGENVHTDSLTQFAFSWPVEILFRDGTGTSKVKVSGTARIGISGSDNGDVFGAARGEAGDRYVMARHANVSYSEVEIDLNMPTNDYNAATVADPVKSYIKNKDGVIYPAVAGSVYGAAENGHVHHNTKVTVKNGLIGHMVYGGGKGKGLFNVRLAVPHVTPKEYYDTMIYSMTAGKVYGNTEIKMTGGHVVRNIYGAGNMGSVGRGNYAGGGGNYSTAGYGEKVGAATRSEAAAAGHSEWSTWEDTINAGRTVVTIEGGVVGTMRGTKDDLPTGNIFGAGRGEAAPNVDPYLSPRALYFPEFFSSYVNRTIVTIGKNDGTGPRLFGSVYGGGQDGHVRFTTHVKVLGGEIGLEYNEANQKVLAKVRDKNAGDDDKLEDMNDILWYSRGNVFGAGSGIGKISTGEYSSSSGSVTEFTTVDILGGTIHRNIYGGSNLGSVGHPKIPASAPDPTFDQSHTTVNIGESGAAVNSATVGDATSVAAGYGGDVYGSSRGGVNVGFDFARVVYSEVNINDGAHVLNNVYGGGEMGYVRQNTSVNINSGTVDNFALGGGKGLVTDPGSASVRGNATVTMIGGNVVNSVFGGGELASVGTFTGATAAQAAADPTFVEGEPYSCAEGTGVTKVLISGGRVGKTTPQYMIVSDGHGGYEMSESDDVGFVFGAGQGVYSQPGLDNPEVNANISKLGYVDSAHVEISGTALIIGSVYGGSENGQVLRNTIVQIKGGQIGCGEGMTDAYAENAFFNPLVTVVTDGNALAECAHFQYQSPYLPYDYYATEDGLTDASTLATDGHTFFGNVFAGGSGYYPYRYRNYNNTKDTSVYLASQGRVRGNTRLEISGGHILTSAYGGSELANVTGDSCVVIMTGGTLGVPRTVSQITAHPVTCYLFGAGKGDQRLQFNKWTNVNNVRVDVKGGIIYGSVFGGGEDGHILGSAVVNISQANDNKPTIIGTQGISYVDGNVFGGGRGFSGDALTAGNVSGSVTVNISGGSMQGSVYGGGRLGSVGYGLYFATQDEYGTMRPDNKDDEGNDVADFPRGHIYVNISGGTIGNRFASDYEDASGHSRGGNVFGASMGRLKKLDESYIIPIWQRLGSAKTAEIEISGTAKVLGNVYGGSELGSVVESTKVTILGGTIGRAGATPRRNYGNVYGGGYGSPALTEAQLANQSQRDSVVDYAGRTHGDTRVDVLGGTVYGNVFGGGEMASVGNQDLPAMGNTLVNIGLPAPPPPKDETPDPGPFGSATIKGDVFGGNNVSGTPLGNINVHIYKTAHNAEDAYPADLKTLAAETNKLDTLDILASSTAIPPTIEDGWAQLSTPDQFALHGVYGGGSQTSYEPLNNAKKSTVTVHYCEENTVYRVYGGGKGGSTNEINHTNTDVIIEGGHIYQVFAGGNGDNTEVPGNQGANVTNASITVKGGIVEDIFGGSNGKGSVEHSTVDLEVSDCPLLNYQVFGGGNAAAGEGDIVINIPCGLTGANDVYGCSNAADFTGNVRINVLGGTINRLFGGAKNANIKGNIEVNVFAGNIHEVFGGNNNGGYIFGESLDEGNITVNVDLFNDMCEGEKSIDFVYGGGNNAPYKPDVVNSSPSNGEYTISSDESNFTLNANRVSPQVNIISGQINTAVFGSGKGSGAATISNPEVYIGAPRLQTYNTTLKDVAAIGYAIRNLKVDIGTGINPGNFSIMGNVFGGGNAATVKGNTTVKVGGTATHVWNNVYGGGNNAEVTGNTDVIVDSDGEL